MALATDSRPGAISMPEPLMSTRTVQVVGMGESQADEAMAGPPLVQSNGPATFRVVIVRLRSRNASGRAAGSTAGTAGSTAAMLGSAAGSATAGRAA